MDDLIKINYKTEQPMVNARELYEGLEIKTAFKDWFPRMCEYGFEKGKDFNPLIFEQVRTEGNREVKRQITDYQITIDMAKQHSYWTQKGRLFLYEKLKSKGVMPLMEQAEETFAHF